MRQTTAVARHDGLGKRTARARVEAQVARMLAFDLEPGVKDWRRTCAAQGWYWTRQQQAELLRELPGRFEAIERDFGPAIVYESTFKDSCLTGWTLEEATMELTASQQVIGPGQKKMNRTY